jgi:TfoX/Sxy family transcriptional regulator of competence genes
MAYSEELAGRMRECLSDISNVAEKEMMGGLAFMVNKKMCVGIIKDEMMCRIDPALYETVLEKNGCRPMDFTGKRMKGWVMVDETGMKTKKDLDYWIGLARAFNRSAKTSKKTRKAGRK